MIKASFEDMHDEVVQLDTWRKEQTAWSQHNMKQIGDVPFHRWDMYPFPDG